MQNSFVIFYYRKCVDATYLIPFPLNLGCLVIHDVKIVNNNNYLFIQPGLVENVISLEYVKNTSEFFYLFFYYYTDVSIRHHDLSIISDFD